MKHENRSKKSRKYFVTFFYWIEKDVQCEMVEQLMLTSGGYLFREGDHHSWVHWVQKLLLLKD